MQITIEALLFLYLGHGAVSSIINSLQLKPFSFRNGWGHSNNVDADAG